MKQRFVIEQAAGTSDRRGIWKTIFAFVKGVAINFQKYSS